MICARSTLLCALLIVSLPAVPATAQDKEVYAATRQPSTDNGAVLCPVTREPIDRACVVRFRNRWVYFANNDAASKFEADPYAYSDAVQAQWQADKPLRTQVKCPVSDKPIDPTIYVGKGEDAVFFADQAAKKKWLEDSAPFRKRLESECYTFQTVCPHSGLPIDPKVSRSVDGRTIYFMCEGCAGAFEEDRPKYTAIFDKHVKANETAWKKRAAQKPDKKPASEAEEQSVSNPPPASQRGAGRG